MKNFERVAVIMGLLFVLFSVEVFGSVQIANISTEDVSVSMNESHITFETSYLNKTIELIDFFVPEELQDDLSYVTPCDTANEFVCQGNETDPIFGYDQLFHVKTDPNAGEERFYVLTDYIFTYAQYDPDGDIPTGFNWKRINQEVSMGYRDSNAGGEIFTDWESSDVNYSVYAEEENVTIKYEYINNGAVVDTFYRTLTGYNKKVIAEYDGLLSSKAGYRFCYSEYCGEYVFKKSNVDIETVDEGVEGNTIDYRDVKYVVDDKELKSYYIVDQKPFENKEIFIGGNFKYDDRLRVVANGEDKLEAFNTSDRIWFFDGENPLFFIPKPIIVDANNYTYLGKYEFVPQTGSFKTIVPQSVVNKSAYPIEIDPSLKIHTDCSESNPFVAFNGDLVNSISDFYINDVVGGETNSGQYVLCADTGTTEERRAKMYKTLFYGEDNYPPLDPGGRVEYSPGEGRLLPDYIENITYLRTSLSKDVGKKAAFSYAFGGDMDDDQISGGSQSMSSTINFSFSNNFNDFSSWSDLYIGGWDYSAPRGDAYWQSPAGTDLTSISNGAPGTTIDESEVDTSADEYDNPSTAELHAFSRQDEDEGHATGHAKVFFLYEGTIDYTETIGGTFPNYDGSERQKTDVVLFNEEHSIPAFTSTDAPTVTNVRLSKTSPTPNEDITGYCTATSSANVAYNWTWYINDIEHSSGSTGETYYTSGIEQNLNTLSNTATSVFDEIIFGCKAYSDGTLISEETNSSTATVTDDTAPTTTDDASSAWSSSDQTVTLSPSDADSGVDYTEYCVDTSNTCTPSTTGTSVDVTCGSGNACEQYVRYRSIDNAGNTESTKSSGVIRIDKENPETTSSAIDDSTSPYTFGTNASTFFVDVTLSCDDSSGSGCSQTQYCTDTGNTCTPSTTYSGAVQIITEGVSYIRYRSTDSVSNTETVDSEEIRIDAYDPVTTANALDALGASYVFGNPTTTNYVNVSLFCDDGDGLGCNTTYYCTDISDTCTPTTEYSGVVQIDTNATSYFRFYSTDHAGNDEPVKSKTIKIDAYDPVTTATIVNDKGITYTPGDLGNTTYINISLFCDDGDGLGCDNTYYCADESDTCTPTTEYSSTIQVSNQGQTYFRYYSDDLATNEETIQSDELNIRQDPTFDENLEDQSLNHIVNLNYDVNCTDPDGVGITYYLNDTIASINENTGVISDNPTGFDEGIYSLLVTCGNGYINTSQSFNYTIINDVPTLDSNQFSPLPNDGTEDLNFEFTASDTEGDLIYNYTRWFVNEVEKPGYENLLTLNESEFDSDDTAKIELIIGDLYENTSAQNFSVNFNDNENPILANYSVSGTSAYVNTVGYFFVDCTDTASSISSVTMNITDPANNTNLYNLVTPYSYNTYRKGIIYTAIGDYVYESVECVDSAGNKVINESVNISVTVTSEPDDGAVGGGGGGSDIDKKDCDITTIPEAISLSSANNALLLEIVNNEDSAYEPSYNFESENEDFLSNLRVVNPVSTIFAGQSEKVGVDLDRFFANSATEEFEGTFIISSPTCSNIEVPITFSQFTEAGVLSLFGGDFNLMAILLEPIWKEGSDLRNNLGFVNVGLLSLFSLLLLMALTFNVVKENYKKKEWSALFAIIIGEFIVALIIAGILTALVRLL